MKLIILGLIGSLLLTGCLKTRTDVRENEQRQVMQQQVVSMQKTNADAYGRVEGLEEQIRELIGRVDVVENKVGQSRSGVEDALKESQDKNQALESKVQLLQEALGTMEKQIFSLNAEVSALKEERSSKAKVESNSKGSRNKPYEKAQEHFANKEWKQSILSFQKYRDENPKGSKFADATYRMGVSFQELGMLEEAKTFYDEVVSKFPKTDEARRAKIRLKSLKK